MPVKTELNEICKVSALKATSALSKLLKLPLGIDVKPVEINQLTNVGLADEANKNAVNLILPILGNLSGVAFFLYSKESALQLCDFLFNRKEGDTVELSPQEISALSEVTNIVMGNFLSFFAHSLQLDFLMHRTADYEFAPFKKVFTRNISKLNKNHKDMINMVFSFQHINMKGYVYIILENEKIMEVLNNKHLIS